MGDGQVTSHSFAKFFVELSVYYMVGELAGEPGHEVVPSAANFEEGVGRTKREIDRQARAAARAAERGEIARAPPPPTLRRASW